jgi:single-stranded DNA-binding protein
MQEFGEGWQRIEILRYRDIGALEKEIKVFFKCKIWRRSAENIYA